MIDLFVIGQQAIQLFWGPILVWSCCAAAWVLFAWTLPKAYPQLRLDGGTALLLALPLALIVSWLLPEGVTSPLSTVLSESAPSMANAVGVQSSPAPQPLVETWPWVEVVGLMSLFLAGLSILGLGHLVRSWWALRRLVARSTALPRSHRSYRLLTGRVRGESIRVSDEVRVPFTCGLVRPTIVLPADFDAAALETVLLHEREHIVHGDLWRTWVATLIRHVFVFHPLAHWLHRDVALHAEICCDRRVMDQSTHSPRDYAQLLLQQTPLSVGSAPVLTLVSTSSQLKQRIQAMQTPTRLSLSRFPMLAWMILITASVGLLAGCSEMEVAPTEAHVTDDAYDLVMELPAAKNDGSSPVFAVVEEAPVMIGGLEALQAEINYPIVAKEAGIAGRVFLQFVVDQEGNVVDPQVVRGIGAGADEEALRALQTMKFIPGVQRGQRVNVKMNVPVTFRLSEYDGSIPPPPPPPVDESIRADYEQRIDSIQVSN